MNFFFGVKEFFSCIMISKMSVKMNLRIIMKHHAADPEIGFLTKSISKSDSGARAMPTAWKLRFYLLQTRELVLTLISAL